MERNPDVPDGHLDLLIIELGEKVIKSQVDCILLFDEIETIFDDFPGYLVVFKI